MRDAPRPGALGRPGGAGAGSPAAPGSFARALSGHTMLVHAFPRRDDLAVAAWIRGAVERGEKVILRLTPADGRRMRRMLDGCGLGPAVLESVELMDAAAVGAQCGGQPDELRELHAELADQAVLDGYARLAMVSNGAANAVLTTDRAGLVQHERDIARLIAEGRVRALCRYHPPRDAGVLPAMLALHHHDVEDDIWGASITETQLRVRGEIDASNADRLGHVLRAAVADGVRVVSLAGLRFCAVAGIRVFLEAADALAATDGELVLVDVDPLLVRNFAIIGSGDPPGLRLVPRGAPR